jgi:predicted enzyme related to lactoylglutathione lyase
MAEQKSNPGTFCWYELVTGNTAAAKEFYTKLLGWETVEMPMQGGTYTMFKNGDNEVCGMMAITKEMGDVPPHWMAYIEVEDVDAAAKKVEELGGKICFPPTDIPDIGRFAAITDPTGAAISLFTGKKD